VQILQRRKTAKPCVLPESDGKTAKVEPCGHFVTPRLRAVTSSQKNTLDAIYERYLKSVGLSATDIK